MAYKKSAYVLFTCFHVSGLGMCRPPLFYLLFSQFYRFITIDGWYIPLLVHSIFYHKDHLYIATYMSLAFEKK